jgi:hypothetical protein
MLSISKLTISFKRTLLFRLLRSFAGLFPLTLQGVITLLVAATALSVFGYGSMDLVVFSLAICALAILIFSLFCAVIGGVIIQRRVHRLLKQSSGTYEAINVEAGFPNETGFSLPVLNYFPLVKLSWRIVFPDFIETRIRVSPDNQLVEEIIPIKRCRTDAMDRQFTVSDVLGFCRYSWYQRQEVPCMALPRTNTVKPLPLLRSLTAEDGIPNPSGDPEGDRMEIRPYAPGDSVRNIMWKVYARNRQLNVRLPEKSVYHSKRTVAYLLSSDNDEAAAAVARVALESGALGEDWAFAADGTELPCETLAPALEAVARSRAIGQPYSYGLDKFLNVAAGQSGAHCIVFAGAEIAPWLALLKKTIGRFPGQFSLVLATDGFDDPQNFSIWHRLFLQEDPGNNATPAGASSKRDLLKLLTELGQLVESTLVVDRKTGFSFDKSLRKV